MTLNVAIAGLGLAAWYFLTWLQWFERSGAWQAIELPRRLNGLFLAVVFYVVTLVKMGGALTEKAGS